MITFNASSFIYFSREMGRLSENLLEKEMADQIRDLETRQHDENALKSHLEDFEKSGLRMCVAQIQRMLTACRNDNHLTHRQMAQMVQELANRVQDECGTAFFLKLSEHERDLFAPITPLFGTLIEDKFPSMIEDIAEAGKCLGLQRSTAAVFHLMRLMETAVQRIGVELGVSLVDEKVWQVILDGINAEIKKMEKGERKKNLASISANLYSVKLAWRNETMHPKTTYTQDEAIQVFNSVRRFTEELTRVL